MSRLFWRVKNTDATAAFTTTDNADAATFPFWFLPVLTEGGPLVRWTCTDKTKYAHELLSVLDEHPARSAEQVHAWRSRIEDVCLVYDCRLPRREEKPLAAAILPMTKRTCRDASAKGRTLEWNEALAVFTASSVCEYMDRPHLLEDDGAATD
jgi:hypothetical protein